MPGLFNDPVAFSIPAAIGLTYMPHLVKFTMVYVTQGIHDYNNEYPRELKIENVFPQNEEIQDFYKRCYGAHMNGFESLTLFAPAVVFAVARGVPDNVIASYTTSFLYTRVLYTIAYMAGMNKPISYFRSMVWLGGVGIVLMLFAAAFMSSKGQ